MTRTTVYLDEGDYLHLKRLARERRLAPAALIRTAISDYVRQHGQKRPWPKSIGAGHSGLPDLGTHDEGYLEGFGEE
ncbi:MAG: hypothetical protein EPN33_01480 [Acidobacteria bacterium]|nr:MAG: hypothetical protein EPN33_01480 [Acidobacteriota bacterium]